MGAFQSGSTLAVIPAYNEEITIGSVVIKAKNYVDEVVVIDDGSSDSTPLIAEMAGAKVIKHEKNGGYGAALKSCFNHAKNYEANVMVIFDSDGQHDPSEIPLFIKKIEEGADVVIGSRFLDGKDTIPIYRKLGMGILNIVTNGVSGLDVSDTQSGYRAYSKKAIDKILINSSGMSAGSEILIQAQKNNLNVVEIPITCSYDVNDPSTYNPIRHGISVLMGIARTMGIGRPLTYFGIPGVIMLFFGMIVATWLFQIYIASANLPFGPTMLMMLLIIVGSLTTYTGLMLHSMVRLIKEID